MGDPGPVDGTQALGPEDPRDWGTPRGASQHQLPQHQRRSVASSASCFYDALEEQRMTPPGSISSFETAVEESSDGEPSSDEKSLDETPAETAKQQEAEPAPKKEPGQNWRKSPGGMWTDTAPAQQPHNDSSEDTADFGFRYRSVIGPIVEEPIAPHLHGATVVEAVNATKVEMEPMGEAATEVDNEAVIHAVTALQMTEAVVEPAPSFEAVWTPPAQSEQSTVSTAESAAEESAPEVPNGIHYYYDNRTLLSGSGSVQTLTSTQSSPLAAPATGVAVSVSTVHIADGDRCHPPKRRRLVIVIVCVAVAAVLAAAIATGVVLGLRPRGEA